MSRRRAVVAALASLAVVAAGATALAVTATSASGPAPLIEHVDPARSVYHLRDSAGHTMDTVKVVPDPTTAGRYLAVYHWLPSGSTRFSVGVATSTDLRKWTYRRTLDSAASQPYLAFSPAPKNGPILAVEGQPNNNLRFKYWTSVSGMLGSTAAYRTFDAPKTISKCAEGTPSINTVSYQSSSSTITSGSAIVVDHHFFQNCTTDREASGVLKNFSSWSTNPQPQIDTALTSAGATGKHGDRDTFSFQAGRYKLLEGGVGPASGGSMGDWRLYLYDGTSAEMVTPQTLNGSEAFANPAATILLDPAGVPSLLVSTFIPGEGAAPGEGGELLYWNPLNPPDDVPPVTPTPTASQVATPSPSPTPPPPSPTPVPTPTPEPTPTPGTDPTPTPTPSPSPTLTPTPQPTPTPTPSPTVVPALGVTKVLTFVEENHSLAQMKAGMPYLYSQAVKYGYADHYTAITHPSEPNYVAMAFGSTMGDTGDHGSSQNYAPPTVFGAAITAGKTAKTYQESATSNCQNSSSGSYYTKHNAWLQVASGSTERAQCLQFDRPSGAVTTGSLHDDIVNGALPNVGMVTPNICNDGHDCSLTTADNWLKPWLQLIYASPDWQSGHLAVVVTADEDDRNSGNTVLTAVLHPSLSGKVVTTPLTHYSWTKLQTDVAGAPCIRSGCTAANMATAFGLTLTP